MSEPEYEILEGPVAASELREGDRIEVGKAWLKVSIVGLPGRKPQAHYVYVDCVKWRPQHWNCMSLLSLGCRVRRPKSRGEE